MLATIQIWALMLLQEGGGVSFDPLAMWNQMTWLGKAVVITMFIMSAWSIGVMIDRLIAYNAARKQSRAPGRGNPTESGTENTQLTFAARRASNGEKVR
jgi:hypothetical protein